MHHLSKQRMANPFIISLIIAPASISLSIPFLAKQKWKAPYGTPSTLTRRRYSTFEPRRPRRLYIHVHYILPVMAGKHLYLPVILAYKTLALKTILLWRFIFDYRPVIVALRRDSAFFFDIADHQGTHLTVVAVFAHGVEYDFGLFAVGVAHGGHVAAAAVHTVVVNGQRVFVGILDILALILKLGDAAANGLRKVDGVICALEHIIVVIRRRPIEAGGVFHIFFELRTGNLDTIEIILIDVES